MTIQEILVVIGRHIPHQFGVSYLLVNGNDAAESSK